MALLSPADQQKLRESFDAMTSPVRLLFFTQTLDCETCLPTRQILDELPGLSDKITIEEVNFILDKDKAAQYGVDRVPAIALVSDGEGEAGVGTVDRGAGAAGVFKDSRIRFLGAPSGYEFIALVQAVLLVGGRGSNLTAENRRCLAAIDKPVTMQVFTTPT